jgi:hypothetical protein
MSIPAPGDVEENGTAVPDELPAQLARLAADLTREGDLAQERGLTGEDGFIPPDRGTEGREGPEGRGLRRRVGSFTEAARHGGRLAEHGTRLAGRGFRAGSRGFRAAGRWLTAEALAMAPRLPVRDQAALRAQFPGRSPDEVADALIEGAARASAAVGGAVGAWTVLPIPPAFAAEIATETLVIVGIEVKLIAELHEVYGMRAPGGLVDRMTAYVAAWARRRGVSMAPGDVVLEMGSPLRRRLRRRLEARAARSTLSLGPLLTGMAAGAWMNHRETRRLGCDIREDLRRRSPAAAQWHA